MERRKFEDSIRHTFDNAEVDPSSNVWTNIELDLEKSKGSSLRRKLLFFQLLAAASVVFAMGIGVGVYVMQPDAPVTGIAQNSNSTDNKSSNGQSASNSIEAPATENTKEINSASNQIASNGNTSTITNAAPRSSTTHQSNHTAAVTQISSVTNDRGDEENTGIFAGLKESQQYNEVFDIARLEDASKLFPDQSAALPASPAREEAAVDPVAAMLSKLAERERLLNQKEAKRDDSEDKNAEKLWTSVGFAAGSFNPVNPGVATSNPSMAMAQNNSIAKDEVKASGMTYTIGASIGTKLSERWVFQGGVNYLTQSSDYTAHNVVGTSDFTSFRPVSIHELDNLNGKEGEEKTLVATSPYNVNNSLRFLSIPLQAGYLVVDRDFGLQLNAGIATDLFLKNTVSAEGAQNVDVSTQEIGDKTAYRTVNLSGLMGTEISYRFAQRYRISLNPGLRYPFNSIYRSELAVKSTPLTFDIGLRFRYIFR